MKFSAEIDHELTFTDETHNPCRIRDAILVDGHVCDDTDAVTAYAHSIRIGRDVIGPEFGNSGGLRAKRYSHAVTASMHHETMYCPCRKLSAEEYAEECKCHDI